jgi:glycosyltransferase involved in cell wall biosynthesis
VTAPVRIAHVIHDLRPGGTERRLLAILGGLDRDRFEPLLVCVDALGPLAGEARALGFEPVVLGRTRRFDLTGIVHLARLLRRERIELVHGWLSLANVFARTAGTIAGVRVRIAAEGGAVTTMDARRGRRDALAERALTPFTDAYVANSQAVADSLRAKRLPREKIVVIPNGVAIPAPLDMAEREQLRSQLGAGPSDALVGMVARLDADFKDHGTLLAAVAALAAVGRSVRAAVVGDGAARPALERRAAELGIADRVTFTGYRSDASRLLAALDVSMLLTYSEGFSNVVLESMAAGVPLVATAIPPNREAVDDGVHALLVPVRDVEATTAAVRRLLDEPSLSGRLAGAARQRAAERFSLEAQAASTMQLYDRLLRA